MQNLELNSSAAREDVDWQFIEEELQDVPPEYKEQRFQPLRHVIDIFSSGDPQLYTVELRERAARLGDCVDMVVEGYHAGFTKSIENYSHILQAFQDARQQITGLRSAVSDATRQLSAQSRHLAQQWQRSVQLKAGLSLLQQVEAVVALPAKIQSAVTHQDWSMATSLLLEACARLAGEDMRKVTALSQLREDVASSCRSIQVKLCETLLKMAYDDTGRAGVRDERPQQATHSPASSIHEALVARHNAGNKGTKGLHTGYGVSVLRGSHTLRRIQGLGPVVKHRVGDQKQNVTGSPGADGKAGSTRAPPVDSTMVVACLASLDATHQAKAFLKYHARAKVRSVIWSAAEAAAAAASQSYTTVAAALKAQAKPRADAAGGVPSYVETLAQKLIQYLSDACLKVLASQAVVLKDLSEAPSPRPGAALDMLQEILTHGPGQGMASKVKRNLGRQSQTMNFEGHSGGGSKSGRHNAQQERVKFMIEELMHVWRMMQEECHVLLSQLLSTALRPLGQSVAAARRQQEQQQQQQSQLGGVLENNVLAPVLVPAVQLLMQPVHLLQKIDQIAESVSNRVEAALGGAPVPNNTSSAQQQQQLQQQYQTGGSGTAQLYPGAGSHQGGGAPFLGPGPPGSMSTGAAGGGGGGGLQPPLVGRPMAARLHFSLDTQVGDMASKADAIGKGGSQSLSAAAELEVATVGYARLIVRAMGGHHGSLYLTPCIYLPLASFIDAASYTIKTQLELVSGSAGAISPGRQGKQQQQQALDVSSSSHYDMSSLIWLKDCMEDCVTEQFMPQAWVDLRARCTAALEHPNAFKLGTQSLVPGVRSMAGTQDQGTHPRQDTSAPDQQAGGGGGGGPLSGGDRAVVPAVLFGERVLSEIGTWSIAMPSFDNAFMGIAENIMSRLLDSFWLELASSAGLSTAFRLALKYEVALAQAVEPDAWLLGSIACCAVPKITAAAAANGDVAVTELDVAAFMVSAHNARPELVSSHTGRAGMSAVAAQLSAEQTGGASPIPVHHINILSQLLKTKDRLKTSSSNTNSLEAELELLLLACQERPVKPEQTVTQGLANLAPFIHIAALAESLDYLANAIMTSAARQLYAARGQGGSVGKRGRVAGNARGRGRGRGAGPSKLGRSLARDSLGQSGSVSQDLLDKLPDNVVKLIHRTKALSGGCLRLLRLELQLVLAQALAALPGVPHVIEPGEDVREVHPGISSLTRSLSRLASELSSVMSPRRCCYVLSGVPAAAAHMSMWLLPNIKEINNLGIDRMVRMLSSLQPSLMSLLPDAIHDPGAPHQRDVPALLAMTVATKARIFDKARGYYQLLSLPAEEVLRRAADKPFMYGYGEWMALLQVHVPGRGVSESQASQLQSLLDKAYGLTAGQKIVGAVGTVINTVITTPVERVADVALDVLKAGAQGLKAGAMLPAKQIGKVFKAIGNAVTERAHAQSQ